MICVLLLLVCTGVATASHVNANCDEYSLVLSVCCNECHLAAVAGRNGGGLFLEFGFWQPSS